MVNRPKNIGTAGESAVVRYLRAHGFAGAERRALAGAHDLGDITGIGPLVVECKSGAAAANASPGQITKWMAETFVEMQNADADYGLLVTKRAGVGAARAGEWWTYVPADDYLSLHGHPRRGWPGYLRVTLAEAVALLRHAGYGDEPTADVA